MSTGIRDWLETDRRPAHLYELLGRPLFDPHRESLLAAVRAAYAELHPFENHPDGTTARRAMELLGQLGRAEVVLSDAEKLQSYHESILVELREAWNRAQSDPDDPASPVQLRSWLERRGVCAERLEWVARALPPPADAPPSPEVHDPKRPTRSPEETTSGSYVLQDGEPDAPESDDAWPTVEKPPPSSTTGGDPPWEQYAEGWPEERSQPPDPSPHTPPAQPPDETLPWVAPERAVPDAPEAEVSSSGEPRASVARPFADLAGDRRGRQLKVVLGVAAAGCALVILSVWALFADQQSWRGRLVQVRGHDGEIHLVVQLGATSSGSDASFVEAFVPDYDFAREISDFVSAEEGSAPGERVVIEGRRRTPDRAQFALTDLSRGILVELTAIQKLDPPGTRAVVGVRRSQIPFDADRNRSELARMIRIHPLPGQTRKFFARFGGVGPQGVLLHPGEDDRRSVRMELPGASEEELASYRPGDRVYAVAQIAPESTADRLVLRGESMRRVDGPDRPANRE